MMLVSRAYETSFTVRRSGFFRRIIASQRDHSSSASPPPTTSALDTSSLSSFVDDHYYLLQQALQRAEESDSNRLKQQKDRFWYASSLSSLPFECTACGKCCRTKGRVYMSPTEIRKAAQHLIMTGTQQFIATYASHIIPLSTSTTPTEQPQDQNALEDQTSNVDTADRLTDDLNNNDSNSAIEKSWILVKHNPTTNACIFLDDATNHCKIYATRPAQCSTYPFWNSILASREAWNNEVRLPPPLVAAIFHDDAVGSITKGVVESDSKAALEEDGPSVSACKATTETTIPYWTPGLGGCEGMRWIPEPTVQSKVLPRFDHDNAGGYSGVPVEEAHRQCQHYDREKRDMPRTRPTQINHQEK